MPKFRFEFTRPDGAALFDEEGKDLPDVEAAKAHARVAIRTVLRDATSVLNWSDWTAHVKGADDVVMATIPFRDLMHAPAEQT